MLLHDSEMGQSKLMSLNSKKFMFTVTSVCIAKKSWINASCNFSTSNVELYIMIMMIALI